MPRKLQVLAIHDANLQSNDILGFYNDFITQWQHKFDTETESQISGYTQVLSLLRDRLINPIEIPDIILIDFLFTDDTIKFHINSHIDPRGVLYASVLIPFFMAIEPYKPMGYEIYSQGIEIAKHPGSGYAKTFLLLLSAIFGDMSENPLYLNNEINLDKIAVSFIEKHEGMKKPDDALRPAIRKYRDNFLKMVENGQIFPDLDSLDACSNALKTSGNLANIVNMDELSLKWSHPKGKDEVYLSSLFFDCFYEPENEAEEKYNEVIIFLEKTNKTFIEINKLLYEGAKTAYNCFIGEESYHVDIWGDNRNEQIVLCFLIIWAINRYEHKNTGKTKYRGNAFHSIVPPIEPGKEQTNQGLERAIKNVVNDKKMTIGKFIRKLDGTYWMFPAARMLRLKTLTILYMKKNGYTDEKYYCDCLKNYE